MSYPSFTIPLFAQLVYRLRFANARYDQIAYLCRHTLRPTYHAKRRACRAGLWIDTSRARAGWLDERISTASVEPLPVLDRTPTSIPAANFRNEEHSESIAEDAGSDVVSTRGKKPARPCLSPLGLEIGLNFGVEEGELSVPGAPLWRSKPLPGDEYGWACGGIIAEETMSELGSSGAESAGSTLDFACRGLDYVLDSSSASVQMGVVYAGLGVMTPRHLKRKTRDAETDGVDPLSRRARVDIFRGTWWNEAQR